MDFINTHLLWLSPPTNRRGRSTCVWERSWHCLSGHSRSGPAAYKGFAHCATVTDRPGCHLKASLHMGVMDHQALYITHVQLLLLWGRFSDRAPCSSHMRGSSLAEQGWWSCHSLMGSYFQQGPEDSFFVSEIFHHRNFKDFRNSFSYWSLEICLWNICNLVYYPAAFNELNKCYNTMKMHSLLEKDFKACAGWDYGLFSVTDWFNLLPIDPVRQYW